MILIDLPRLYPGKGMYSHMVGNSISELHTFAENVGIKRCHFSNHKGKNQPHYDVAKYKFESCIKAGAVLANSRDIIKFLKGKALTNK